MEKKISLNTSNVLDHTFHLSFFNLDMTWCASPLVLTETGRAGCDGGVCCAGGIHRSRLDGQDFLEHKVVIHVADQNKR